MAVALTPAGNDRIEFGDLPGVAGLTEITVALTVKLNASPADLRLCGQWGDTAAKQAFLLQMVDSDEVGFTVEGPGSFGDELYGKKTTGSNLASGGLYRIVARIYGLGGSRGGDIWINGSSSAVGSWFAGAVNTVRDSAVTTFVGYEVVEGVDCEDGDYSEFAIWGATLPDADCIAYGNGFSPDLLSRTGRILYAPMIRDTNDKWGGATGTLTGGSVAVHPRVIYPRRKQVVVASAAAATTFGFLRDNAGVGAMGGGPFSRANAGLGVLA